MNLTMEIVPCNFVGPGSQTAGHRPWRASSMKCRSAQLVFQGLRHFGLEGFSFRFRGFGLWGISVLRGFTRLAGFWQPSIWARLVLHISTSVIVILAQLGRLGFVGSELKNRISGGGFLWDRACRLDLGYICIYLFNLMLYTFKESSAI